MTDDVLLQVKNLKMYFPVSRGVIFERKVGDVKAVDDVSFNINRGETLGLVGESGSGKTTAGKCILRLYTVTGGSIIFDGIDLATLKAGQMRALRPKMQPIYQDPYSSLNPRHTVEQIVGEPMVINKIASGKAVKQRVGELLEMVGLAADMAGRYPHMFSGGQRQRIGVARALSTNAGFLVCDEPVSALDVSIQAQIVNLLEDLQESLGLTLLFISHDLSVVRHISDRIAVMYLGKIVELSESHQLYREPLHPYSQALISAVPIPDPELEQARERILLTGEIPSPLTPPAGCRFHPRCSHCMDVCRQEDPEYKEYQGRWIACHLYN
ncbi:MAG: ABC transporter ATP-binding protein [Planctomycetota bacterium]|jgi:oligopeptide transport system ATP-binding protein